MLMWCGEVRAGATCSRGHSVDRHAREVEAQSVRISYTLRGPVCVGVLVNSDTSYMPHVARFTSVGKVHLLFSSKRVVICPRPRVLEPGLVKRFGVGARERTTAVPAAHCLPSHARNIARSPSRYPNSNVAPKPPWRWMAGSTARRCPARPSCPESRRSWAASGRLP